MIMTLERACQMHKGIYILFIDDAKAFDMYNTVTYSNNLKKFIYFRNILKKCRTFTGYQPQL